MKPRVRVGITMGDPSGIGPSIIAKALPRVRHLAEFVIIGDRRIFEKQGDGSIFFFLKKIEPSPVFIDLNNVHPKTFQFGKIKAEYGRAAIEYLDKAMELLKRGQIDCLVTAPISKEAVNLAGSHYSGHTEYFEALTGKKTVMMLINRKLKFSLVTRHLALEAVPAAISQEKILRAIRMTHKAMRSYFSIAVPRIVVNGLNPHASDNGLIGREENRIIKPSVAKSRKSMRYVDGPLAADVAVKMAAAGKYDAIIAMYHDQALIPLKLSGDESGVNLTLGLPFIRTSPLHGTAFDIAATGLAQPDSFISAIKLAIQCSLSQKKV